MVYNRRMHSQWIVDAALFPLTSPVSRGDDALWRKLSEGAFLFAGETVHSPARIAGLYRENGLSVEEQQILTIPQAAAAVLRRKSPEKRRAMFCGSRAVKETFLKAGFEESLAPDYIVIGDGIHGTLDDFSDLLNLCEQGATMVCLSPHLRRRRNGVDVLAGGAVVRMLEEAAGISAVHLDTFANAVVPAFLPAGKGRSGGMIVVSGQAENVLAPAAEAGMKTILVSSAMAADTDLFGLKVHPDWIIQNFNDIGAALQK